MILIFVALLGITAAQVSLPGFNVDVNSWTTSGISSGACMASQMHVAYADSILGVGMVAGVTYYCSEGAATTSLRCMDTPSGIDVPTLVNSAQDFAADEYNDPTSGLVADKVFLFQGSVDTVVLPENGPKAELFYGSFASTVATEFSIAANHGFPTDFYGGVCDETNSEYINNCGYNAAFEMMNHFYGGLQRPAAGTPTPGEFYLFDQTEFFTSTQPSFWSMDTAGYIYVPSGCVSGVQQCRLHIALHGCEQGREYMGTTFSTQTGYQEVGELNNIIILFPQAVNSLSNPFGCWDWWGYNTYVPQYLYACRDSGQTLSMYRMMRQVSGLTWSP